MFHYDRQFKWMEQSVIRRWCPSKFGRTGTEVYDLSGYSQPLSLVDMDPSNWVESEGRNVLNFPGNNARLLEAPFNVTELRCRAFSFWIKPNTTINASSAAQYILQLGTAATNGFWYIALGNGTGLLTNEYILIGDFINNSTYRCGVADGGNIPNNAWTHIAISQTSTSFDFWINGIKKSTVQSQNRTAEVQLQYVRIGAALDINSNANFYYLGLLDDLAIFNTPLESSQAEQLYHAGPGAGLVPYRRHRKRWVRGVSYKPVYRRRTKKVGNIYQDKAWQNLNDNIVGRWCPSKFGRTGTQLYDLSGYNNTGTLIGMDPATDWVNNGLDLDGSGDYVSGSGNSFSVRAWSVWFNPRSTINSSSSFQTILQTRFGNSNSFFVSFGSSTILLSNEYITITDTTGLHRLGVNDGGSISAGDWHHLFINSNYTGYEIWLDGVKKSLTAVGTVGASPIFNALRIGCSDGDGGGQRGFFNGEIDDVTISNTPLEPSQILDLYHAGPGAGLSLSPKRSAMMYPPSPPAGGWKPYWLRPSSKIIGAGI